ncbi:hypothetical protein [Rhizorhabdus dicambivorans]|uniref:hypothetical protein n=1 Tax=Rhizorhabdus dicambivorans TaxID=1850238 RepID=UPI001111BE4F|nr:hypothetical protein [Rhizorhabdus dicambivorans]
MDEFFAFTSTYIATYKPYSAFYHVIPLELTDAIDGRSPLERTKVTTFARLVAGAARAEAYAASRSRPDFAFNSSLTAANATLSAALGAASVAGYPSALLPWITAQWASLRSRLDRYAGAPDPAIEIASILQLLARTVRNESSELGLSDNRSAAAISGFIQAALTRGVNSELLRKLDYELPNHIDLVAMLAASREERIQLFNRFVSSVSAGAPDRFESTFIAGLLLAIAGNGSFEMLRSARDLSDRIPTAIIWFGICAALFEESNVLTGANCLGRRIARDLDRPYDPFNLPKADLGLFEYRAMSRDAGSLEQINVGSVDAFCIEILPDIVTYVPREFANADTRSIEEYQMIAESFREIRHVIDRTARRLERSAEPRQRELYGDDSKSRRRSR